MHCRGRFPSTLLVPENSMKELIIGATVMTGPIQKIDIYLIINARVRYPTFGNRPLRTLQGYTNQFTGPLPFDWDYGGVSVAGYGYHACVVWCGVVGFWKWNHGISIPHNIRFVANLEELRLSDNQLTGTIPESTFELSNLFRLEVHSNLTS